MMIFENPRNGFRMRIGSPFLCTLLFGPFYFVLHGIWIHALLSLLAAVFTYGLSWLVYPLCAQGIVRHAYLSQGWKDVTDEPCVAIPSAGSPEAHQASATRPADHADA